MKKRVQIVMVTSLLFFISSCTSTTLKIKVIEKDTLIASQKIIDYKTFWDAMENIDLSYSKTHQLDYDHRYFAESLKLVLEGNFVQAESELKKFYISAGDSLIKKHSINILKNLFFFQSKWEALLELYKDSNDTTDNNITLVEAFNKSPQESYSFLSNSTVIPTALSLSGCPVIEVELNGCKKNFWLDTGAGLSVVASDIAEECNVFPIDTQKSQAGTGTSKKIDIQSAIIEDLRIGDISIKNHPAIIINKKDLEFKLLGLIRILKIDGIIGWNAIQNMDIEINYKKKVTTIKKPIKMQNIYRNLFWLGYPFVIIVNQEGIPLNFGLDTGGNKTNITENIFRKISIDNAHNKKKYIGSAGGFEKFESQIVSDLALILNGYALHFKDIGTHPQTEEEFVKLDGTFGSDLAKDCSIRIDYLNGRFELKLHEKHSRQ